MKEKKCYLELCVVSGYLAAIGVVCNEGCQKLDGVLHCIDGFVHQPSHSKLHDLTVPTQGKCLTQREFLLLRYSLITSIYKYIIIIRTYFAVDNACVDLQHTSPDVRMRVMKMFLQCVKEAVPVGFTRFVQPVTTQDPHKDLSQHLTHSNAHCVTLETV